MNHFGRRESDGVVVDLFWNRGDAEDEFRVEVRTGARESASWLHPLSGREAIEAFHHPFVRCAFAARPSFRSSLD